MKSKITKQIKSLVILPPFSFSKYGGKLLKITYHAHLFWLINWVM